MQLTDNRVSGIITFYREVLGQTYSRGEVDTFIRWVLEHYSDIKYSAYIANPALQVAAETLPLYQNAAEKLLQHQPIQYILGQTEFYGLHFKVNPAVLIPRPETEELVDLIIKEHSQKVGIKVLDLCTGSGCIAIVLNKNLPASQVWGLDVSTDALAIAAENNVLNNASVQFFAADVLADDTSRYPTQLDVVVSNPPYVPQAELENMDTNVKAYEPHLALFVPDNEPLLFYKKISTLAFEQLLSPGGRLYFECHADYAKQVVTLLDEIGYKNCQLITDITGRNRMVSAEK